MGPDIPSLVYTTDPTHPLDPRKIFSPSFCPDQTVLHGSSTSEDLICPTTFSFSVYPVSSIPPCCQSLSPDPLSDALSYILYSSERRGAHVHALLQGFIDIRIDTILIKSQLDPRIFVFVTTCFSNSKQETSYTRMSSSIDAIIIVRSCDYLRNE